MSRALVFTFSGYSGFDAMVMPLLPKCWQVRIIARAFLRTHTPKGGVPPDPLTTRIVLVMPFGTYRITDRKGHVESCAREHVPGM